MSAAEAPRRTVPLEAGISAENPPCPVCGEPLFGYTTFPLSPDPVRRCENCDIGVTGVPPTRDEAKAILAAGGKLIPNHTGIAARLGASGWAGIERSRRLMFTKESVKRLGGNAKTRPSILLGAQTLLNSFTFGHNIGLGMLGRGEPVRSPARWQRRIDSAITVLASPVVLVAAVIIELTATLVGRGGALTVDLPVDLPSSAA